MKAGRYSATLPSLSDGQIAENTQVNASGVLLTAPAPGSAGGAASTGTQSSVNDTNADATILAANTSRKGATIFNDSTSILYLLLASGTASATNFSVRVKASGFYELPPMQGGVYTGVIKGIWSADASGAARVTEFT